MSTQDHEIGRWIVDGLSRPRVARGVRAAESARRTPRIVVELGRVGLIWLPAYTLLTAQGSSSSQVLLTSALVTAVWFVALRSAVDSTHFTLGVSIAAAIGTVTGLFVVSALSLWLPEFGVRPSTLATMALAVFAFSTAWEYVVRRSIAAKCRVLILGVNECASALVEEVGRSKEIPFRVVGIVDDEENGYRERPADVPRLGSLVEVRQVVEAQRPDLVVLADGGSNPDAIDRLLDVKDARFKVCAVPHFYEHVFGRVPLRHLSPAWFTSVLHLRQRPQSRLAKRSFDLVVAAIALVVTAPLFPIIALLVRLTPGPIIFRQTRVGEGGTHFTMCKFRTMRDGAEELGRPMWARERDDRVTRVGRLLRTTRLDELPQLWNVLKGDMSIVGPRPERPEFARMLGERIPFWTRRLLVKPGITGWAQIRRGYAADCGGTEEKLAYDLWYLRHRNLVIDLAICAKTFSTFLLGSGAR